MQTYLIQRVLNIFSFRQLIRVESCIRADYIRRNIFHIMLGSRDRHTFHIDILLICEHRNLKARYVVYSSALLFIVLLNFAHIINMTLIV